jgi:hypothetical protein
MRELSWLGEDHDLQDGKMKDGRVFPAQLSLQSGSASATMKPFIGRGEQHRLSYGSLYHKTDGTGFGKRKKLWGQGSAAYRFFRGCILIIFADFLILKKSEVNQPLVQR